MVRFRSNYENLKVKFQSHLPVINFFQTNYMFARFSVRDFPTSWVLDRSLSYNGHSQLVIFAESNRRLQFEWWVCSENYKFKIFLGVSVILLDKFRVI
jgi:hypothetical protein